MKKMRSFCATVYLFVHHHIRQPSSMRSVTVNLNNAVPINPLALELDIYSLAHHLCKM